MDMKELSKDKTGCLLDLNKQPWNFSYPLHTDSAEGIAEAATQLTTRRKLRPGAYQAHTGLGPGDPEPKSLFKSGAYKR